MNLTGRVHWTKGLPAERAILRGHVGLIQRGNGISQQALRALFKLVKAYRLEEFFLHTEGDDSIYATVVKHDRSRRYFANKDEQRLLLEIQRYAQDKLP